MSSQLTQRGGRTRWREYVISKAYFLEHERNRLCDPGVRERPDDELRAVPWSCSRIRAVAAASATLDHLPHGSGTSPSG
jgi:hypothetical protein